MVHRPWSSKQRHVPPTHCGTTQRWVLDASSPARLCCVHCTCSPVLAALTTHLATGARVLRNRRPAAPGRGRSSHSGPCDGLDSPEGFGPFRLSALFRGFGAPLGPHDALGLSCGCCDRSGHCASVFANAPEISWVYPTSTRWYLSNCLCHQAKACHHQSGTLEHLYTQQDCQEMLDGQ